MTIVFIILCFIVCSMAFHILRERESERQSKMNIPENELSIYEAAYNRERENVYWHTNRSIKNYSEQARKYIEYMEANKDVDSERDCQTITSAIMLCLLFAHFCFFYGEIDDVGSYLLSLIFSCFCAIVLGVVFGGGAALIANKFIHSKMKDTRYWLICISCSTLVTIIALIILLYSKGYEYEPN